MRGRFSEARALLSEAKEASRELGMETELASGLLRNSAEVEVLAGDLAAAETELRQAVEILERIGDFGHLASVAPDLAFVVLAAEGREREALEIIDLGAANMLEDDVDAQVRARAARAVALGRLGDVGGAERLARDAVKRGWATDYPALRAISLEALAEVFHGAGRDDEAEAALEKAIAVHDAKGNIPAAETDRRLLAERRAATAR
jgi:tetratricopeptide (TPR) repeat protein